MSRKLIVLEQLVLSEVCNVQVHQIHPELDCLQCFLMPLLAIFNQVLRQLQNGLLGRLKFLRSVKIRSENVFSRFLTLLLSVYFGEVLHVDQTADLLVEEHV